MPEKILKPHIEKIAQNIKALSHSANSDSATSLFQGLSEDNLQNLLSYSLIKTMEQGREIIQQGDEVKYFYFIIEGSVKTFRSSPDGEEATIRMLKDGETFMDAVIFMGGTSPISVQAIKDSKLLLIPASIIRQQIMRDTQLSRNLLQIVARYYKEALQQIDSIVTKTPAQRLGYYFLKLHMEQGPDNMDMKLPFQKSMIANHLGMKPETFSRALGKLKTMGINVDQENITMRDSYALCHLCDSDIAFSCPRHGSDECPICLRD